MAKKGAGGDKHGKGGDKRGKGSDTKGGGKRNARQALKKRPNVKAAAAAPAVNTTVMLSKKIDNAASSVFHQTNLSNPNPKIVGNVSNRHQVLVVGDGDFSFSLALATNLVSSFVQKRRVDLLYDSQAELFSKYPTASANVRGLQITHAEIHVGVDATALGQQDWIHDKSFDRILFNFPHLGGATEEDVEKNQNLLFRFFESARPFVNTPRGEVHVTLRNTLFYNRWDVEAQAERAGYSLKRRDPFDINLYPGYEAQRTHPASFRGEPPSTKGAKTHVFSVNTAWVKPIEEADIEVPTSIAKAPRVDKKAKAKGQVWACEPCKMNFHVQTKFNAHINSSKHAKVVKALKKQKK
ncbi:hypothetical protein ACHHYP_02988 [Achlya hypogyna]|uniref:C2H2-type domain-containing protein n=1 Tax=Achlya hypogyna TaxID=1202772 RepID=A0A1V9Z513_ACHHY|nr:hypothetical protein ACHHYP_02988 [Achlya hypogyna]